MAEETVLVPRLKCAGLKKSYNGRLVLDGVELSVLRGETVALMGRSGCGKTTLLKCLCFLENPDAGDAFLESQTYMKEGIARYSPRQVREQIGIVFQEFNLFPNMTCLRNISLALEVVKGVGSAEAREQARSMAQRLDVEGVLDRYPDTLSGGQAQRIAIARALVMKPSVLLLDEITSALDPETTADMIAAIKEIREFESGDGLAILVVTHILSFAEEFANRIAFLHNGRILEEHPAADFRKGCAYQETRTFVTHSRPFQ